MAGRPKFKGSKELKARLDAIQHSRNLARTAWSFHNARTWRKVLLDIGYTPEKIEQDISFKDGQLDTLITFVDLNTYFDKLVEEAHKEEEKRNECTTLVVQQPSILQKQELCSLPEYEMFPESGSIWLPQVPGQSAILHPKQAEAAREIFDAYYFKKHTGRLLLAATGTGKTYVFGSVLANLIFHKYHVGRTYSPWPYVVVTKASVVLQTERVMREAFGLNTVTMVHVLNIEQLRSQFGEMFIEEITEVKFGEAHVSWRWKKFLHPFCIIWDECQILKNEDSQQSQIAQAYNRVHTLYEEEELEALNAC